MTDMNAKRILVIEDDFELNGFFRKYLMANGYIVDSVYSCEDAMNVLMYGDMPDVVIVDMELWDGNCLPIMELLETSPYAHITVIMCSGYTVPQDYHINMDRIQQFLLKPVSPRSLSLLVKSLAPMMEEYEYQDAVMVSILPGIQR
jgi:DNA-binding response OmpR family regulator